MPVPHAHPPTNAVLVVGSINLDRLLSVESLPRWGETVLASGSTSMIGGKGANQAIAAVRCGARVALSAAVGSDGEALVQRLSDEGIDTTHVDVITGASTGVAVVVVDRTGENLIVVEPGANGSHTGYAGTSHGPGDWTLLQGEIPPPAVLNAARSTRERGGRVALNAAPAGPWVHQLRDLVDQLIVNEGEFLTIFGRSWSAVSRAPAGWPSIVVTRGGDGCAWLHEAGTTEIPAHPTDVVDTVGAGDAFSGSLVAALARGRTMPSALRAATVFAAMAVARVGAADSYPTREEFEAVNKELWSTTHP